MDDTHSRIRPLYNPQLVDGHENLPSKCNWIHIYHPSDISKQSYIANLPANDARSGGIRYAVAHWCMYVLTELSTLVDARGFFSLTHDGEAIDEIRDSILMGKQYFFRVEKDGVENRDYALIPSFQDFRFPHQNLPSEWKSMSIQLSASDAERTKHGAEDRDKSCRLTGAADGYEVAHIIPANERVGGGWFDANAMAQYTPDGIGSIHNMSNAIVLRADVHRIFDARAWIIVPDGDAWVSYILKPGKNDPQLLRLYHNVRIQPLERISMEFIFARFAYAILDPRNANLGFQGKRKYLFVDAPQSRDLAYPAFKATVAALSKSRSASPTKRTRQDGSAQADERSDWPLSDSDINDWEDDDNRGRTKKRNFDETVGIGEGDCPGEEQNGDSGSSGSSAGFKRRRRGFWSGHAKALQDNLQQQIHIAVPK